MTLSISWKVLLWCVFSAGFGFNFNLRSSTSLAAVGALCVPVPPLPSQLSSGRLSRACLPLLSWGSACLPNCWSLDTRFTLPCLVKVVLHICPSCSVEPLKDIWRPAILIFWNNSFPREVQWPLSASAPPVVLIKSPASWEPSENLLCQKI